MHKIIYYYYLKNVLKTFRLEKIKCLNWNTSNFQIKTTYDKKNS